MGKGAEQRSEMEGANVRLGASGTRSGFNVKLSVTASTCLICFIISEP